MLKVTWAGEIVKIRSSKLRQTAASSISVKGLAATAAPPPTPLSRANNESCLPFTLIVLTTRSGRVDKIKPSTFQQEVWLFSNEKRTPVSFMCIIGKTIKPRQMLVSMSLGLFWVDQTRMENRMENRIGDGLHFGRMEIASLLASVAPHSRLKCAKNFLGKRWIRSNWYPVKLLHTPINQIETSALNLQFQLQFSAKVIILFPQVHIFVSHSLTHLPIWIAAIWVG